ncbi:PilZ domain-containing protein [Reinekea blandensis]|uniref:PilZ domain-containing protein n=1 Tax=Reinekea blandensis MED297 TaxID=314283 RepID=A4BBF7_9GAMM|nr:PilZ domain-containing protein [Reinekea blandensis]EAR10770.1 hypothetical protein MED297_12160 [Reinekea sp. MED297] [Reinekea blandensis MED297]
MSIENRRFARIPFDADIRLTLNDSPGNTLHGTLQDISLKGAMIALNSDQQDDYLAADTSAELIIQPEQSTLLLTMTVQVAYCLPEKRIYGLNFVSLDIDTAAHLRRLVEMNLGSDASLQRELQNLIEAMEDENRAP